MSETPIPKLHLRPLFLAVGLALAITACEGPQNADITHRRRHCRL